MTEVATKNIIEWRLLKSGHYELHRNNALVATLEKSVTNGIVSFETNLSPVWTMVDGTLDEHKLRCEYVLEGLYESLDRSCHSDSELTHLANLNKQVRQENKSHVKSRGILDWLFGSIA